MSASARFAVLFVALLIGVASAQTPDPPSRFARLDGARIHYKVHGRGRTAIVLVHGWGCDMTSWREQIPRLAQKATVIAIDLPGHGKSDAPKDAATFRHFARAVRAVMDDAKVPRAILVGRGMGTPVIRQVDRVFPTRVRGLVAIDGALTRTTVDHAGAECGRAAPEHFRDDAYWKDDKITVPMLAIHAKAPAWDAEYETAVRALGSEVDYQVMENTADLNARLEAWLVKKGYLR